MLPARLHGGSDGELRGPGMAHKEEAHVRHCDSHAEHGARHN
jgi:hypothetical protein